MDWNITTLAEWRITFWLSVDKHIKLTIFVYSEICEDEKDTVHLQVAFGLSEALRELISFWKQKIN